MADPMVAMSISKKLGQQAGGSGGMAGQMMKEPGTLTDALTMVIKGLQTYQKLAGQIDPKDPDLTIVRKIVTEVARLIQKDQQEGENEQPNMMSDGTMMGAGMMGMGGDMTDAPKMPDISQIIGASGMQR